MNSECMGMVEESRQISSSGRVHQELSSPDITA